MNGGCPWKRPQGDCRGRAGPGSTQPELTSCAVTARPTQLFRRGAKQRKSPSGHSFSEFATSAAGAPRAQRTRPETAEPRRCRPSSRPSAQGLTLTAQEVKVAAGRESPSPLPTKDTML